MDRHELREMVERTMERLDRALSELNVQAVLEPDWEAGGSEFVWVGIRSESGIGATFLLVCESTEQIILVYSDYPNSISEVLPDDLDDIPIEIARAARYGVIWAGWPFRKVPFLVSPETPQSEVESIDLRRKGYVRYDPPWPGTNDAPIP